MTSRKRRSSLPENNPKHQKINKESESQSFTSTKKNAVAGKARKHPPSTQKKKAAKAIAKKAIKNSELSKQAAVRKKSTILNATKNSAAKNVPAKGKIVRLAKDVTSTKKGTQKPPSSALKGPQRSQSRVFTSVQNKSGKIKSSKSVSVKQVKTVQSVKKNVNTKKKTSLKAASIKKNAKNGRKGTQSKSSQTKTKKDDVQPNRVDSNPKTKAPAKAAAEQSKPVPKAKQSLSKTTGKQAKLAIKAKQTPAKGTGKQSKLEPKAKKTQIKVDAKQLKLKPRAKRTLVNATDKKSKSHPNTKQAQVKGAAEKLKSQIKVKKAHVRTCVKKSILDTKEKQAVVKNSKLGPKAKQAQVKVTDKQPDLKHKPVHAPAKAGTKKTANRPLHPLTQQSVNPEQSDKRLESKPKRGRPKSLAPKNSQVSKNAVQNTERKTKACSEDAKKGQTEPVVSHIPVAKDVTVGNVSTSKCDSKQSLNSSCNGKLPNVSKIVGKAQSSQATLKRKRTSTKPVDGTTKNKAKRQKVVQSESKNKETSEDDQKTKRVSILDLCNEIAGEIESDTVEVIKEEPGSLTIPVEELTEHTKAQDQVDISPPSAERSPANQSKRFFPSRKPLQIRCKLEQRTSPGTKNSKWKKIKLKKSFAEHNLVKKRAALPSLEAIKTKGSQIRQLSSDSHKPLNSKSDTSLAMPNKPSQSAMSERTKNSTLTSENRDTLEKLPTENGLLENHLVHEFEAALDEGFRLHLDSSPENSPVKKVPESSPPPETIPPSNDCKQLMGQMAASAEKGTATKTSFPDTKSGSPASNASIQKEIRKLKEADKVSGKQPIIDAGQKRFGAISCSVCGMLYTATNPEDEAQHLLFHNQFISAVKYVGWKKERIVAEYPDGKVIMVLPDDPKYALKKVEEIREMVDNDLGFQQVPLWLHPRTKTFLFISTDKKIVGCLIAEHIQRGYRVIDDFNPGILSDTDKLFSERVKAWCCSTTPEPAICGVSRIWVFSLMRRKKIASRMLECVRNHFIYGSHLNKDEIAFSDPTPDGKLFAAHYCGTRQFLVYNFVSGHHPLS